MKKEIKRLMNNDGVFILVASVGTALVHLLVMFIAQCITY